MFWNIQARPWSFHHILNAFPTIFRFNKVCDIQQLASCLRNIPFATDVNDGRDVDEQQRWRCTPLPKLPWSTLHLVQWFPRRGVLDLPWIFFSQVQTDLLCSLGRSLYPLFGAPTPETTDSLDHELNYGNETTGMRLQYIYIYTYMCMDIYIYKYAYMYTCTQREREREGEYVFTMICGSLLYICIYTHIDCVFIIVYASLRLGQSFSCDNNSSSDPTRRYKKFSVREYDTQLLWLADMSIDKYLIDTWHYCSYCYSMISSYDICYTGTCSENSLPQFCLQSLFELVQAVKAADLGIPIWKHAESSKTLPQPLICHPYYVHVLYIYIYVCMYVYIYISKGTKVLRCRHV